MDAVDDSILRFVDTDLTTVRLDLNDGIDFTFGEGLDLGEPGLEKTSLGAPGVNGEDRTSDKRMNTTVTIPLTILPRLDIDEIDALYDLLRVELERPTNILERRRLGSSTSLFMDTFRADFLPTMERGQTLRPDCVLFDAGMTVQFERLPDQRLFDGTLVHR